MTRQKKISTKTEEYQTPLQVLLSFLRLPHKIYRDIYIYIAERRLSSRPLIQCEESIAFLANQAGVEPSLMAEKVRNMALMKWIEFEQVGNRDVNQIFVLSPVWRYKPGMDKIKFAVALQEYQAATVEDIELKMNTEEIYDLMLSVCPHTLSEREGELCKLGRFPECTACAMREKMSKNG